MEQGADMMYLEITYSNFPAPSAPSGLLASSVSTQQIDISWNDNPTETSYTLFRNLVNNSGTASAISGLAVDTTNYSDTGLTQNTKYFYWVKAYNNSGESGYSSVVSNSTYPVPPVTPSILDFINITSSQIEVVWSNPSNETSFTLYRNTVNNSNTATAIFIPENTTNYINSGLLANTNYYFWVQAYNSGGASGISAPGMTNTPSGPPLQPNVLSVSATSNTNELTIIWENVANETTYTLFRHSANVTNSAVAIMGFGTDITNHTDASLSQNTLYYYWVKAYNVSGESPFGNVGSQTTLGVPPLQVTGVASATITSNSVTITWANVANETGYTLYRSLVNDTNSAATKFDQAADVTNFTDTGLSLLGKGI
jgi:hypothetical protein